MTETEDKVVTWELPAKAELRIEIGNSNVNLSVVGGEAEIFGTEMALNRKYELTESKIAIFTWTGCKIKVEGRAFLMSGECYSYIGEQTSMLEITSLHGELEKMRDEVVQGSAQRGPVTVVAGPTDSGKSSLCKILCNYAARSERAPLFVDLDVGQGIITMPATVAAVPVDRPIDIEEGLSSSKAPICYFYGQLSLDKNPDLYRHLLEKLSEMIQARLEKVPASKISGVVINTCGWVEDLGLQILKETVERFKADIVVVLDQERLYAEMKQSFPQLRVQKLVKSGGVVTRNADFRKKSRLNKIREYFYGPRSELSPHSVTLSILDIVVYQIGGGPQAPVAALPAGEKRKVNPIRLAEVLVDATLNNSVLAVSASPTHDRVLAAPVAGFVYVTEVNVAQRKISLLCPTPGGRALLWAFPFLPFMSLYRASLQGPLPSRYLLSGGLKWLE